MDEVLSGRKRLCAERKRKKCNVGGGGKGCECVRMWSVLSCGGPLVNDAERTSFRFFPSSSAPFPFLPPSSPKFLLFESIRPPSQTTPAFPHLRDLRLLCPLPPNHSLAEVLDAAEREGWTLHLCLPQTHTACITSEGEPSLCRIAHSTVVYTDRTFS